MVYYAGFVGGCLDKPSRIDPFFLAHLAREKESEQRDSEFESAWTEGATFENEFFSYIHTTTFFIPCFGNCQTHFSLKTLVEMVNFGSTETNPHILFLIGSFITVFPSLCASQDLTEWYFTFSNSFTLSSIHPYKGVSDFTFHHFCSFPVFFSATKQPAVCLLVTLAFAVQCYELSCDTPLEIISVPEMFVWTENFLFINENSVWM